MRRPRLVGFYDLLEMMVGRHLIRVPPTQPRSDFGVGVSGMDRLVFFARYFACLLVWFRVGVRPNQSYGSGIIKPFGLLGSARLLSKPSKTGKKTSSRETDRPPRYQI